MRVRIALRKNGALPSEDHIQALVEKELRAPKDSKPSIKLPEILEALLQGQEVFSFGSYVICSNNQLVLAH